LEGGNVARLSPDSEGRLVASTRQEVRLLLVRGELTSAVRTPVRWTVQAGPYLIQAAGTEYVVGWAAGRLDVTVRTGRVIVTGGDAPAGGWTVVAGEHLSLERGRVLHKGPSLVAGPVASTDTPERPPAPVAGPPVSGESPAPGESPVPPGQAGIPVEPVGQEPETRPPASAPEHPGPAEPRLSLAVSAPGQMAPPTPPRDGLPPSTSGPGMVTPPESPAGMPPWKALLLKEEYAKAVAELERSGLADFADTAGLADLQAAANAARYAGRGQTAITLLTTLRQRFPGTAAAQMAAFLIGRVHSEQMGDHRAAVGWFSTYLTESPSGELAEQALGRKMDAAHRAGQRETARATAAELLRRYPASPFVALANRILTDAK
jgi:TolA-binding protein